MAIMGPTRCLYILSAEGLIWSIKSNGRKGRLDLFPKPTRSKRAENFVKTILSLKRKRVALQVLTVEVG